MLCLIIFDRFLSFQNRFETRQNFTMICYLLSTVKLEHSTIPHFAITVHRPNEKFIVFPILAD